MLLDSRCANCLAEFPFRIKEKTYVKHNSIKVDLSFKKNDQSPEENIKEISVAQALSTIFNIPFTTTSVSPDQVCICYSCCVNLRDLFLNYKYLSRRQRKESWVSQRIQLARTRQIEGEKGNKIFLVRQVPSNNNNNNNNNQNSTSNRNCGGVEKSTQTDLEWGQNLESFVNTNDEDDRQSSNEDDVDMEIKTEAEEEQELFDDEYSDPLQLDDEDLNEQEEEEEEIKSSTTNNIPVVSPPTIISNERLPSFHSRSRSKFYSCDMFLGLTLKTPTETIIQSQEVTTHSPILHVNPVQTRRRSRQKWNEWSVMKDLPTFPVQYNLPHPERYSAFRLKSIEPPFISPCECKSEFSIFSTFAEYKKHVGEKHIHRDVFQCPHEPATPNSYQKYKCRYVSWDFQLFFKHCVKMHKRKPIEPEEEKDRPDLDEVLNEYLLPEARGISTAEEAKLYCFARPELVKKIKDELIQSQLISSSDPDGTQIQRKIPPPPYKCDKCYLDLPVEFKKLKPYIMHMGKNVHKSRVFNCTHGNCSLVFSGKSGAPLFIQHCQKLHKLTPDLSTLPVTVKLMDGQAEEEIEERDRRSCEAALVLLGDPPYNCPGNHDGENKNNGPFNSMPAFWTHLKTTHFKNKQFICPKCGKLHNFRSSLISHMELFCGRKRKKAGSRFLPPFICDICQKEFSSRGKLGGHRICHREKERSTCELCGKSFGSRTSLEAHLRLHRNERFFVCEQCGKSYVTSANLRSHQIVVHAGAEARRKFNEYHRLYRRRTKNKDNVQNEQEQENEQENANEKQDQGQTQSQDDNLNLHLHDLDFEMEEDSSSN